MALQAYLIVIEQADKNYSAYAPDMPGCIATGSTIEKTIGQMKTALQFHVEGLGESIPQPKGILHYIEKGEIQLSENCLLTEIKIKE